MKKSYNKFLFLYILAVVGYLSATTSLAKNSEDVVKVILEKTSGTVVEHGLKYEMDFKGNGEVVSTDIFYTLPLNRESIDVKVVKDDFQYCIEFSDDTKKGFVQYVRGEEEKIVVSMVEKNGLLNFEQQKTQIDNILKTKGSEVVCFEYTKASTTQADILHTKDIIEEIMKEKGVTNLNSVKISGGYSLTAYTGEGKPMKVGTELIDINCAIRSYDSGNYVIIGTPVISTCY